MIRSAWFVFKLLAAWAIVLWVPLGMITNAANSDIPLPIVLSFTVLMVLVLVSGFGHVHRVKLIAGEVNARTLSNRQRRQIEIPLEPSQAFDLLAAAISELPGVSEVKTARDSLQIRARLDRIDPYGESP